MKAAEDFKRENGSWSKYLTLGPCKSLQTVSGRKWDNMENRCKPHGWLQKQQPSYIGCTNEFGSFNDFVEWHRSKIGYGFLEIDKDVLFKGNKVYSAETCTLLPRKLNQMLTGRSKRADDLPLGVCFDKETQRYLAQCSNGYGKRGLYQRFDTPDEAFSAYKKYKENLIRSIANEWRCRIEPKAYEALQNFVVTPHD